MMNTADEYVYPLPKCYCEVAATAMATALFDMVQEAPLHGERAIKDRVWHHCENMLQKYRERDLTNDYVSYVCIFHAWYTLLYQHEAQETIIPLIDIREIASQRASQDSILNKLKQLCTSLFFPQQNEMKQFIKIHRGIIVMPHKANEGYYATFVMDLAVHRSRTCSEPQGTIQMAEQMIDERMHIETR